VPAQISHPLEHPPRSDESLEVRPQVPGKVGVVELPLSRQPVRHVLALPVEPGPHAGADHALTKTVGEEQHEPVLLLGFPPERLEPRVGVVVGVEVRDSQLVRQAIERPTVAVGLDDRRRLG
jgi:hypothetical protein